ncbi:MAG: dTDP-4-dehydrorhamnose reductase [Acidobacteriia bacterium]|nr:dTDP-4-dehydrorhamnose reductase [Terriglobia bacterium]
MRILLTGKNGQVGAELARFLPHLGAVVAFDRQQLDLSQPDHVRRAIREIRPQIIVNAAAYTAVDQAETDETAARAINAEAPRIIAEEAKKIGAGVVHYSTDYVFDGSKTSPYEEDDPPHPLSVYGRTKLAGEQAIRDAGVPHLIFRTAWVYGTRGRNFLLTILRLATQREELKIVHDQTGAPTWSREIARATASILEQRCRSGPDAFSLAPVSGTYHMTAGGTTTWYEFAQAILEEAAQAPRDLPWLAAATSGHPLLVRRIVPITTAEYPTPARRPAYSVLSNSRLGSRFGCQLPPWRAQLHSAFRDGELPPLIPADSNR